MKKFISIFLVAAIGAASLTGCAAKTASTASSADQSPIEISLVGPVTGDYAEYGIGYKLAAEIQVEKWNKAGGINGRKIELKEYDEQSSLEEGVTVAQKIAGDSKNYGVVGHFISDVEGAKVYQQNQIPMISPTSSTPNFTAVGDYIFRNNATIKAEASAMLDACLKVNKKKLGVVHLAGSWGEASFEALKTLVTKDRKSDGFSIVADDEISDSVDYSATLEKFKKAGADVGFMFCFYNSVVPFSTQAKNLYPNLGIVAGVNCFNDKFLSLGKSAVEGVLAPSVFGSDSTNADVQYFIKAYQAKANGETPSSLTAQAYDSVGILLTAIKNEGGKLDHAAIRDQIAKIDYQGVGGEIKFDSSRDASKTFETEIVKNGKWVTLG